MRWIFRTSTRTNHFMWRLSVWALRSWMCCPLLAGRIFTVC